MTLTIRDDLVQGTDEWLAARCGLLTASTIGQLITTKTLKVASNPASRALVWTLVAERITGRVEPTRPSWAMERGRFEEPFARDLYAAHYAPVDQVGLMILDEPGIRLGYSPDGLVGDDGLIEIKSRDPKTHVETILSDTVPAENMAQIQTGLYVSGRAWCDYISFSSGMPLWTKRVWPDDGWFEAIREAVTRFEEQANRLVKWYAPAVEGLPVAPNTHFNEDIEI